MLKAVIFDLNGIFLQSPKLSDRIAKDFGVPVAEFLSKLNGIMAEARKPGAQGAFNYWRGALAGWGVRFTEKQWWDYWFKSEKSSEEMIKLAEKLRKDGIKVFILSNNFRERAEYYGHYQWIHIAVDKIYYSWQTGFVKPDSRAWQLILSENNLKADECLYFDDQQKNIEAAKKVGIPSFLFVNEKETEAIIEKM